MRSESKGARLVSVAKIRAQHRRDLYTLREALSQADNVRQSRRKAVAFAIRKAAAAKRVAQLEGGSHARSQQLTCSKVADFSDKARNNVKKALLE